MEVDREEERSDTHSELEELLRLRQDSLNLHDYLHPSLADALTGLARWMGVPAASFLIPLLPTAASLLNPKMKISVKRCMGWREPFIFYTGLVADSGSKKTPIINTITSPLTKLQVEEDARYEKAKDEYEIEFQEWKTAPEGEKGEPPAPPTPLREFFVKDATREALDEIKASQQNAGFILIKDELSGLIGSHGAYKGGRGDDKESMLSGNSGDGIKKKSRWWQAVFFARQRYGYYWRYPASKIT
ncbi:MAG: DUF3987 domain-containing protein [Calothrix sp. SM1_7_51]|nr:DUF3987 domain-containing protein [Calothrix sp. SM1_7_51]